MKTEKKRKAEMIIFAVTLVIVIAIGLVNIVQVNLYNKVVHRETLSGAKLFSAEETPEGEVSVRMVDRGDVWTKVFDFDHKGITKHTHQAYTYDFPITNHTSDEVSDFKIKFTISAQAFIDNAWTGSFEIHQNVTDHEYVATVPDMRQFNPDEYDFDTFTADGVARIRLNPGDYFIYYPASDPIDGEIPQQFQEP